MESLLDTQRLLVQRHFHGFVAYFAREIISTTNKIRGNGYMVIEEYPVRDYIVTDKQTRADVVIIEVLRDQEVILVVECKTYEKELIPGRYQLQGYMVDLDCGIGIIMTVSRADVYRMDHEGFIENVETIILSTQEGIDRMVEIVNNLQ